MTERLLFRPAEAGEAIGVSRSTVYALIAAGTIPSIRINGIVRVPVDGLKAWIARQAQEQSSEGR
jgi:excisionase family DNA binding protein